MDRDTALNAFSSLQAEHQLLVSKQQKLSRSHRILSHAYSQLVTKAAGIQASVTHLKEENQLLSSRLDVQTGGNRHIAEIESGLEEIRRFREDLKLKFEQESAVLDTSIRDLEGKLQTVKTIQSGKVRDQELDIESDFGDFLDEERSGFVVEGASFEHPDVDLGRVIKEVRLDDKHSWSLVQDSAGNYHWLPQEEKSVFAALDELEIERKELIQRSRLLTDIEALVFPSLSDLSQLLPWLTFKLSGKSTLPLQIGDLSRSEGQMSPPISPPAQTAASHKSIAPDLHLSRPPQSEMGGFAPRDSGGAPGHFSDVKESVLSLIKSLPPK